MRHGNLSQLVLETVDVDEIEAILLARLEAIERDRLIVLEELETAIQADSPTAIARLLRKLGSIGRSGPAAVRASRAGKLAAPKI